MNVDAASLTQVGIMRSGLVEGDAQANHFVHLVRKIRTTMA
jgi:hypothetical protein